MARVVVTGGAGFLGSHLCRALLDRGDHVVAIDNLVSGSVANIEELFGRSGFAFVEHDVSNYMWVPGAVDAVMHLASPASPVDFERIPIQILKVGGLGTHNCLGLALAKSAKFFLASTSEVYGDPLVHPQPETYWGNVNPIGTRGVYDEAKRYAEAMTMAYHRHHGLDVRIVRIFNSILSDEQVLYDDGTELRRETIGELAARIGHNSALTGYRVPAFDPYGMINASEAIALVGHPPSGPCFEVSTRYGRSIRVTGDHSLFVEGEAGLPHARTVSELQVGERIAISGRVEVPVRDRSELNTIELLERAGVDPQDLRVEWEGVGDLIWDQRYEFLERLQRIWPDADRGSRLWPRVIKIRRQNALTVAEARSMELAIPSTARVSARASARGGRLPAVVTVTDELLWLLGLWVAEGSRYVGPKGSFLTISTGGDELDRASKIIERELDLHVVRAASSAARAGAIFVHGRALVALWDALGFVDNRKRIPGWILGLPLTRLKWFIDGYREGDGVHSGAKLLEAKRHEFSTTSTELKDDLVVALGRFGICPSIGRYETTFKKKTGERRYPFWRLTVANVQPWSPLEWDSGVDQQLNARRTGDLVWAAITDIRQVPPTDLVYDFSVPGRENFYAGSGVMAHNTYGTRMRPDDGRAVSNFLVQALRDEPITIYGDGSQSRSFTYVDDEIRGFLALLDSDVDTPTNIGNDNEFTIRELAELVLDVTGSNSEIVYLPLPADDPTQRKPDLTKARTLLGWEPTIQLREGLERTAEYFRSQLG